MSEQWKWMGCGRYVRGDREVYAVAAGLFQARKNGRGRTLDVVDGTIYTSATEAKEAADRL